MDGKITAEWEPLNKVVIHRPGLEMRLGLLEPFGSLYERAFSMKEAIYEHERFEHILEHEFGCEVIRLEHEIINAAERSPEIRAKLIALARKSIGYSGSREDIALAEAEFDNNTPVLDTEHYLHVFIMRPMIELHTETGVRNVQLQLGTRQPPANLYFMRDQQMTTDKGIVISRMAKPARRREPEITEFLWREILDLPIARQIQEPGTIEGGEFMPMGDFALVGIGDRTNRDAVDQLLEHGLGFPEVGVVHQPAHPLVASDEPDPMIDMHLDTYFNVASDSVVIGLVDLWEVARLEVYRREGDSYVRHGEDTTLLEYVTNKGFDVVPVTTLEQLCYASNFLCIRNGLIAAIEVERNVKRVLENLRQVTEKDPERYGKLLDQAERDYRNLRNEGQFFPHKKELYQLDIEAYPLILENLTGGYGGAHCMTMALSRG